MGYEVRPDGTIIAPDEAAAIRLSKKLREQATRTTAAPSGGERKGSFAQRKARPGSTERVRQLAGLLLAAGEKGASSRDIADALGIDNPKGLSPYLLGLKREIEARTTEPAERCFWQKRGKDKARRWYANPQKLKALGID
jgi:hypothetical protein